MRVLLILILLTQVAYGQTIEWSNSRKLRGNSVYTHIIGQNNSGIYLLRQKNRLFSKYVILEKYHHQLGFAFSRSLLLQKSRIMNAEVNEHGIFLVTVRFNKASAQNELVISFYDDQLNQSMPSQKTIDIAPIANYYDRGDFKLAASHDRKYLSVLHTEISDNGNRVLSIKTFDNQFNELDRKLIELPINYERSAIHDFKLHDNLQSFFIVENIPKKTARKGMLRSSYSLYCYDSKKNELVDYQLSDTSHFLQSIKIHFDHLKSELNVSGFYSREHKTKFKGVFNAQFQVGNLDSNQVMYTEIPRETVAELIGQKNADNGKELQDFTLHKAVATNDGTMVMVAERNSISNEEDILMVNGTPQALARNIYNFDDVLVMSLDSNREVKWYHVIQKNQSSMNDGGYFGSIVLAVTSKSINLMFNDNMRNSGNVIHYSISPAGELSDRILLNSENEYVNIIPGESRQISPNSLLLPTVKNKKFALLKISYVN